MGDVTGMVLGACVTGAGSVVVWVVRGFLSQKAEQKASAEKAARDAEWRGETKARLERVVDASTALERRVSLLELNVATLTKGQETLEGRQQKQSEAHQREVDRLREELKVR